MNQAEFNRLYDIEQDFEEAEEFYKKRGLTAAAKVWYQETINQGLTLTANLESKVNWTGVKKILLSYNLFSETEKYPSYRLDEDLLFNTELELTPCTVTLKITSKKKLRQKDLSDKERLETYVETLKEYLYRFMESFRSGYAVRSDRKDLEDILSHQFVTKNDWGSRKDYVRNKDGLLLIDRESVYYEDYREAETPDGPETEHVPFTDKICKEILTEIEEEVALRKTKRKWYPSYSYCLRYFLEPNVDEAKRKTR